MTLFEIKTTKDANETKVEYIVSDAIVAQVIQAVIAGIAEAKK